MTIEDDIRHALREDAGDAAPPPGGWDDVRSRAVAGMPRRRVAGRPVVALIAAAVIAAMAVGIAIVRSTSDSPSTVAPATPPASREIAAVIDERLVVIDAESGAEVRVLAEGVSGAVSVDDQHVYVSVSTERDCDGPALVQQIARVPLAGGPLEPIADGVLPRVSPDGRWLAYRTGSVAYTRAPGVGSTPACHQPPALVIRDTASGEERRFSVPGADADPPQASMYPLDWSADSQLLLYEIYRGGDVEEARLMLDVGAESGVLGESNSEAVQVPPGVLNVFGLDPDGSLLVSRDTAVGREIALADPTTGVVTTSVVAVEDGSNVYHAAIDPSGTRVLYVADPSPSGALRVITIGASAPSQLVAAVAGAAWIRRTELTRELLPPAPDTTAPIPESTATSDVDEEAVRQAYLGWLNAEGTVDDSAPFIEDFDGIRDALAQAQNSAPPPLPDYHGRVDRVTVISDGEARVEFSILQGDSVLLPRQPGTAIRVDGTWKVSRETVCTVLQLGGTPCPARS